MRNVILYGSKRAPQIYIDYVLCREFHITPEELYKQDSKTIEQFLYIMNLEGEKLKSNTKSNGGCENSHTYRGKE